VHLTPAPPGQPHQVKGRSWGILMGRPVTETGIQLGSGVGSEDDQILIEHVVDGEDHRPADV
jgi:hypothetical protein